MPISPRHSAVGATGTPQVATDSVAYFSPTPGQKRIWLAQLKDPDSPIYNCAFRWILRGPLDRATLERTFQTIIRRHQILAARFPGNECDRVEIDGRAPLLQIPQFDLRALPPSERDSDAERLGEEEARKVFDIQNGPLIRVGLVRLEAEKFILMVTIHHLVADAWSFRVIIEEMARIYPTLQHGSDVELPEPTYQYVDFANWLIEKSAQNDVRHQLAYWRGELADYRRLQIPGDLSSDIGLGTTAKILSRLLPRELTDSLQKLSSKLETTIFVIALSAFMALMSRYSGQTNIAVGSALAGRHQVEFESLIGMFINHVVFKTNMAGDPPYDELVERVRKTTWDVLSNQEVPFEQVVAALNTDGGQCPEPFSLVNFNCYRAFGGSSDVTFGSSHIRATPIPSRSQGALYELNIFMVERKEGCRLSLEYNDSLYSAGAANDIFENFSTLLEQIAANPKLRISQYRLPRGLGKLGGLTAELHSSQQISQSNDPTSSETYALPASFVQERFWLLNKLDPSSPAYNLRSAVRLKGRLAPEVLEYSLQRIVDRHEILRTTFAETEGSLKQVIRSTGKVPFRIISVENAPKAEPVSTSSRLLAEHGREPFDLVNGPLFRAILVRLGIDEHILVIVMHHIIADGWSQSILQRELWTIYEALDTQQLPALPQLAIQYADFAAWQKEWITTEAAEEHLNFWLRRLAPPLPVLNFPTDRPIGLRTSYASATESLHLPEELTRSLKDLSRSEQTTVFTLMLAAFALLLFRFTGERDVLVGSPAANRRAETEPLIGPFSAPIALRMALSDKMTVTAFVRHAAEVVLDAMDHADLPFELLLEHLKVRTVQGRNPLFQFYFLYQVAFLQAHQLPNLSVTPMPSEGLGTPFELQLSIIERTDGIHANLEYGTDLFDAVTVRAILQCYEAILHHFVASPGTNIDALVLPIPERLKEEAGGVPKQLPSTYLAPRNDIESGLVELWQELLEISPISVRDNFFDLGGQSLMAATLVLKVKARFGVSIDITTLLIAPTIEALATKLREDGRRSPSQLVALRQAGTRPPLICVHPAGGHLLEYREFVAALPKGQPVYGLRAPDDIENASPPPSLEQLAERYECAIRSVQHKGPYQICGLSFGGLLAFEIGRRLALRGEHVSLIALFDTGNWAHYRQLPPEKMAHFRRTYLADRLKKYGRNLVEGRLHELFADAAEFMRGRTFTIRLAVVRVACGILKRPLPRFARSKIVAFTAAGREYTPQPYLGQLVLFRAEGRTVEYGDDPTLGWHDVAQGGVSVHVIPGNHLTMLQKPHVAMLVQTLEKYLADSDGGDACP